MKVSVIIPCYRQAKFLPEAVESVLQQTRPPDEIIVASGEDDLKTADLGRLAVARGVEFVVLHGLKRGVADARNEGVRAARNRLILPLDADDKLDPTFLEKCLTKLPEKKTIVTTNLRVFGGREGFWNLQPYSQAGLLQYNNICAASLFTKDMWEETGGYDETLIGCEDWSFWISCSRLNPTVHHIEESLVLYRDHAENKTKPLLASGFEGLMESMMRVTQADLFSARRIQEDLHVIACMSPEAVAIVDKKLGFFPNNSILRLFKNLAKNKV